MPWSIGVINVAVAVIFNSEGKILISERPPHQYAGGLWEFPGGKVESNESIFDALKREISEELNIQIISAEPWLQSYHDYPDRSVLLHVWFVRAFSGEPQGMEGQMIRWVDRAELPSYTFPSGNDAIIKKLLND